MLHEFYDFVPGSVVNLHKVRSHLSMCKGKPSIHVKQDGPSDETVVKNSAFEDRLGPPRASVSGRIRATHTPVSLLRDDRPMG